MKPHFVPRPYAGQATLPFPYGYGSALGVQQLHLATQAALAAILKTLR